MRGKLMFIAGLGAGFVLGTRAGREKYEELVRAARKVRENPTVQEASGVVQEQANKLVSGTRDIVTDKLSHSKFAETKTGERLLNAMESGTTGKRDDELATAAASTKPVTSTTPTTTTPSTTPSTRPTGSNTSTSGY